MTREDIKFMLRIAIGIALIVLAIKFFVKILPYLIVILAIMLLYDSYKHYKFKQREERGKVKEAIVIEEKNNE